MILKKNNNKKINIKKAKITPKPKITLINKNLNFEEI